MIKDSDRIAIGVVAIVITLSLIVVITNEVQIHGCLVEESKKRIEQRHHTYEEALALRNDSIRNIGLCWGYYDESQAVLQ